MSDNLVTNVKDPSVLEVFEQIANALSAVKITRQNAKDAGLLNTQEYLDFEDELNKVSTMDPNTDIDK